MAFCPNCGTESQGAFCAKCGSNLSAAGAQTGGAPPPPAAPATSAGLDQNLAAALCYLATVLTGILFLVLEPYNKNKTIRFHAFQAIFFFVAMFACYIVLTILAFLPFINILSGILAVVLWVGSFIVWIMLMVKAYNNQRLVLPIIGPMAEKQA